MNKGFEVAHSCVELIEAGDLEDEELNHCFYSLNQYYRVKREQNKILIGLGGDKL